MFLLSCGINLMHVIVIIHKLYLVTIIGHMACDSLIIGNVILYPVLQFLSVIS